MLPPPPGPARFPSGWRARLGRDPIPILLREGSPALVARVRRALIDDEEAPGPAEIVAYPEVKAFLRKQEKNGGFPVKAAEKAPGIGEVRARAARRSARSIGSPSFGLDAAARGRREGARTFLLSSQAKDGGIADLTLGETPESRGKMVALHFHGWALAVLCRAGLDDRRAHRAGFSFLLAIPAGRRRLGLARRAHRFGGAPVEPPRHRHGAARVRRVAVAPHARARRGAPPSCWRPAFCSPIATPIAGPPRFWEQLAEPRFYTDVLDALDGAPPSAWARRTRACARPRPTCAAGRSPTGSGIRARPAAAPAPPREAPARRKEREAARWLTVRVLIVLRRVN